MVVFSAKDRTGDIKQLTTGRQQRPCRVQHPGLLPGKFFDIRQPPAVFDIRVSADHTAARTRHIQQDSIKRFSIPPRFGPGQVRGDHAGIQFQPLKIFPDSLNPLRQIHCNHFQSAGNRLQNQAGLASGSRTSIQDALSCRQRKCGSNQLRGFVLHRDPPIAKAWDFLDRARRIQSNAGQAARDGGKPDPFLYQYGFVLGAGIDAPIYPQGQRRSVVRPGDDAVKIIRPVMLYQIMQMLWKPIGNVAGVDGPDYSFTISDKVPEHAIDQFTAP